MNKRYLSAEEQLVSSYQLAAKVLQDGFLPDFIVAVWRGGTPIGIAVQEFMEYCGVKTDHIAIRTSSYNGIGQRRAVSVTNIGYLLDNIEAEHKLLIVDDVFDSGKTIEAIIETLHQKARRNAPEQIRVATPYFKPSKNLTDRVPDYFCEELESWIVFPHSLCGLDMAEIVQHKPTAAKILAKVNVSNA